MLQNSKENQQIPEAMIAELPMGMIIGELENIKSIKRDLEVQGLKFNECDADTGYSLEHIQIYQQLLLKEMRSRYKSFVGNK